MTAMNTAVNMNEIQVEASLVKEQMTLELGMRDAGRVRFRKMIENAKARGQEDETVYGDKIIGVYVDKVAGGLEQWVNDGMGKAGARRIAQPYIQAIDYRVTAMLGLKVICERLMTDKAALGSTAISIARMMENELKCTDLRAQDRKRYNGIMKMANEKGEYKRKVDVLRYLSQKDGIEWSRWSEKNCMHIGMVVINCIQEQVALVEFYDQYDRKGRTTTCMRPTKDTRESVDNLLNTAMKFCAPVLEPTVIPPKPWVAGELQGGYWTDYVPRREMVKVRNRHYLEQLKYTDMPTMLKALNGIQDTRWRVRGRVLKLLDELLMRNSELGGAPRAEMYELPSKPADIEVNEVARKKYRQEARAVHEDNVVLISKRLSYLQTVETARKYAEYDAIYMPHNVDFRSRVYPLPSLNPQGADYCKALLEFADGVPLGEKGLEWLHIHVANLFGVDKVSYDDRIKWCQDNLGMLEAIALNPFSNREWCEADKPFQAYSAVIELIEALESPNPEEYVSHIPIALDGSCSGIQVLSCCFRDEIGGANVNLLPSDKPSDIYQVVADKTIIKLEAARKGDSAEISQEEDEVTDAQLAQWWLDFGISRKVTKRNCMTFPYGSKARGFSDQLLEDHLRPFVKDGSADNPLLRIGQNGKLDTSLPMMKLSNFLAKLNYESVQETVVKAAEAMDWMQACARIVAKEGRPVTWNTPLNFPVVQNYRQSKEARVETHLAGERKVLSIREDTLKIDKRKSANAISPNIVHSLDASHLMQTVANAHAKGITNFALIHDSFGAHAGLTEKFYWIIRESFIQTFDENYFPNLLEQFKSQVPPERHDEFPPLPEQGKLDPMSILDSEYCFA
ncbi:DNA-directed RNA polymerase [Amphritea sp. HPY]|uniref:DNA-directed RNA polymerase n=1 Tax=Amphritea sp. HPY TaxID=3421652 RepID=UPI003D7D0D91